MDYPEERRRYFSGDNPHWPNQQMGTLNYNRKPELWVDNGKSIMVEAYDRQQQATPQKRNGLTYL